jgi:hypothetical protein
MGETNWPNNEREAKIVQFAIVGRPERALIDITRPSGHPISSKKKKNPKKMGNKFTKSDAVAIYPSRGYLPNTVL